MSQWNAAAICAVLLAGCRIGGIGPAVRAEHGVEYRGGRWFDGTRFVPRTMPAACARRSTCATTRPESEARNHVARTAANSNAGR